MGRRAVAHLRLGMPFYAGWGAPAVTRRYPECRVRAAKGRSTDLLRSLLAAYRGEAAEGVGAVEEINYRCAAITVAGTGERLFLKEFPRQHWFHGVERALGCSRVDRAWRAAHLLPRLGVLTPPAVGTVRSHTVEGAAVEYLATEWLDGAVPFPERLKAAGEEGGTRAAMLREVARAMRGWHELGIYLRDLVKNVLVRDGESGRSYWLTDLDSLHPYRWVTRKRLLRVMRQLGHWAGPLSREEAHAVCEAYLGNTEGPLACSMIEGLLAPD